MTKYQHLKPQYKKCSPQIPNTKVSGVTVECELRPGSENRYQVAKHLPTLYALSTMINLRNYDIIVLTESWNTAAKEMLFPLDLFH
mgnify:FL=1